MYSTAGSALILAGSMLCVPSRLQPSVVCAAAATALAFGAVCGMDKQAARNRTGEISASRMRLGAATGSRALVCLLFFLAALHTGFPCVNDNPLLPLLGTAAVRVLAAWFTCLLLLCLGFSGKTGLLCGLAYGFGGLPCRPDWTLVLPPIIVLAGEITLKGKFAKGIPLLLITAALAMCSGSPATGPMALYFLLSTARLLIHSVKSKRFLPVSLLFLALVFLPLLLGASPGQSRGALPLAYMLFWTSPGARLSPLQGITAAWIGMAFMLALGGLSLFVYDTSRLFRFYCLLALVFPAICFCTPLYRILRGLPVFNRVGWQAYPAMATLSLILVCAFAHTRLLRNDRAGGLILGTFIVLAFGVLSLSYGPGLPLLANSQRLATLGYSSLCALLLYVPRLRKPFAHFMPALLLAELWLYGALASTGI